MEIGKSFLFYTKLQFLLWATTHFVCCCEPTMSVCSLCVVSVSLCVSVRKPIQQISICRFFPYSFTVYSCLWLLFSFLYFVRCVLCCATRHHSYSQLHLSMERGLQSTLHLTSCSLCTPSFSLSLSVWDIFLLVDRTLDGLWHAMHCGLAAHWLMTKM